MLEEDARHGREDGVFYVTDLVRCPLKRGFELSLPRESHAYVSLEPRPLVGRLMHLGVEEALKRAFGEAVETEDSGGLEAEREAAAGGRRVRVRGRIDAVLRLSGARIGVEVKTVARVPDEGLPLEWHVDQARIYNWLYPLSYTVLLYVTPEGLREYEVRDRATDREIVERASSEEAPRYQWECKYCPFNALCPVPAKRRGEQAAQG